MTGRLRAVGRDRGLRIPLPPTHRRHAALWSSGTPPPVLDHVGRRPRPSVRHTTHLEDPLLLLVMMSRTSSQRVELERLGLAAVGTPFASSKMPGFAAPSPGAQGANGEGLGYSKSPGRRPVALTSPAPVVLRPLLQGLGPVGGVRGQGSGGGDLKGRAPAVLGVLRARMGPMSPDLKHFSTWKKFRRELSRGTSALAGGFS